MTEKVQAVGFYELPVPIAVSHEVLGSVCATRLGNVPAQIHAPLPLPTGLDYPRLVVDWSRWSGGPRVDLGLVAGPAFGDHISGG